MSTHVPFFNRFINAAFLSLSTLCAPALFADTVEQVGLVPEDYFDFVFTSDVQAAPNGQEALFVKTWVNDDASGRDSRIYKVDAKGGISAFTQGNADSFPRWSADGSEIAFLRPVDDDAQVFIMSASGGEARQITFIEGGVAAFDWFPGGKQLLLTRYVNDSGEAEQSENEENQRAEPDIVVVSNPLYIADGSGYLDDKRSHLFLFDIQTGTHTQLTEGANWNASGATVSHDGQSVFFHANKTGLEYEGNNNSDIYQLNIEDKTVSQLTSHQGPQYSISLAQDENTFAYLHNEDTYAQTELFITTESGNTRNLTADFDRDASNALWSSDNQSLYFTTNDNGANRLFRVNIQNATVSAVLTENKSIRHLSVSNSGDAIFFTMESSTELPELFRLNLSNNSLTQLTHFNSKLLEDKALSAASELWFTNDKDMQVQGFVHKPVNFASNKSYPLILNIKGGPGGMWGHQWFHENQMYAAEGYAVAYVNYRGSSGYGQAHSLAVRLDYGGADYEDNMQFLEEVLKNNPWIDKERLYVTGGSHGGFLTNWITTKTDRFKAAVTQRSVSSWISEAGTQEFTPYQMTKEFGGNLWTNFDYYWDRSPLKYANKVTTPTLIIHSDEDMITPIGQGQEWFYALKANNVPVEMVIFKGETHSLSRTGTPTNLVERLERIINWFERHQ